MSTLVLLTLTGLALAAMYFLLAAGLSLIFGLMDVLNFAHGAFFTWGAYAAWWTIGQVAPGGNSTGAFLLALLAATLAVGLLAAAVEVGLLRPLYRRPIYYQVLLTLGVGLALGQLTSVIWRPDARPFPQPDWLAATSTVLGARVPNNRFLLIAAALLVFGGMLLFLRRTRYGLVVRAGAENREMVQALGIDVDRAFTVVFALGGALAGLGGVFGAAYFGSINPNFGAVNLIFAFIVVVIGGLGSITGSALAAVVIGLAQQFGNYYTTWAGDFIVVMLLAIVLLVRPRGLLGTLQ